MKKLIIFILFLGVLLPGFVFAQEGIKLSITPPLINNNVEPGQVWQSSIKLVNNNSAEINVYVQLADFKNGTEEGTVQFLPTEENSGTESDDEELVLLSKWMIIEPGPYIIPAFKSVEIPFIINVPEKAEPGGHYAAILTGTKPPEEKGEGSNIKISSLLASLIFLNVDGEVVERGLIREFSTEKKYYGETKVDFKVRFENTGNVHVQPQGEIGIYNMWDKIQEAIPINQKTSFGNVLPGDIRKWDFTWDGSDSILDMGRYRAELILTYGSRGKETIDQSLYFWVIYLKPVIIFFSSVLFLILLIVFLVRRSIKNAVKSTQGIAGITPKEPVVSKIKSPQRSAVLNLKEAVNTSSQKISKKTGTGWRTFKRFLLFIIFILVVLLGFFGYKYYRSNFSDIEEKTKNKIIETIQEQEEEKIEEKNKEEAKKISSSSKEVVEPEEIIEAEEKITASSSSESEKIEDSKKNIIIKILNGSGKSGLAKKAEEVLIPEGYIISSLGNADNFNYSTTLIKHKKGQAREAEAISGIISSQTELEEFEDQEEDIIIIIGKNYN